MCSLSTFPPCNRHLGVLHELVPVKCMQAESKCSETPALRTTHSRSSYVIERCCVAAVDTTRRGVIQRQQVHANNVGRAPMSHGPATGGSLRWGPRGTCSMLEGIQGVVTRSHAFLIGS